ncbi:MAG: hypothetical protein V3571_08335 [Pseudodesulfovibrio sp.]
MQKITGWSVVRQSVALMWRCRIAVLGFLVVQIVLGMAYGVLGLNDPRVVRGNLDAVGMGGIIAGSFLFGVVGAGLYLLYTHYMVTALRGEPVLVPERPVLRLLRMLWTGIKIGLTFMLLMGAASLPIIGLAVSMPGLRDVPAAVFAVGVGGFAVLFSLLILFLRLELAMPGVVAGDGTTLREAWRLSRGRSWRMFASVLWLMLLCIVLAFVVALPCFLIFGSTQGPVFVQVVAVSNAVPSLLGVTLFCVWYVRLADDADADGVGAGPQQAAPRVENLAQKIGGYYGPDARD